MLRHRRSLPRSTVASGLFVLAMAACSSPGQLVLGIGTDLSAQDQIDEVRMRVVSRSGSVPPLEHAWEISGRSKFDYRLPGSFNLYADEGAEPAFDVTLDGYLKGEKRVTRQAALSIQKDEQLFIRLGLVARCEDIGCPRSLTCIEGMCKPQKVDVRTLPTFRAALVERSDCSSGTVFMDTSEHVPLPSGTTCDSGFLCSEGTCLADPISLPGADPVPFTGGAAELFGTAKASFFPVGAIDAPRFHASSSLLPDGRVLIVGGFPNANIDGKADGGPPPVAGAVVYDPESAAWKRIGEPPLSIGGHTATVLPDGKVLFVGASGTSGAAMLFDPATSEFTKLAPPRSPRYFHTATLLDSGNVLIVGGTSQNAPPYTPMGQGEVFDPATQTFRTTAVGPVVARVFHTATKLPDGRVLLAGGIDMSGNPVSSAEVFVEENDRFVSENPLSQARAFHTATLLQNGSVLLVGGEAEPGQPALVGTEAYVPRGVNAPAPSPPAPFGRVAHLAIALGGDRILFVGGAAQLLPPTVVPAGGAFLYERGVFTVVDAPAVARVKAFGVLLRDGDVLIGGGSVAGTPMETDGGLPGDGGLPIDMSIPSCNPVGATQDALCTGGSPRCLLPISLGYGPRPSLVGSPQCVPAGTVPIGGSCGFGVGPDGGMPLDECVQGALCMPDVITNDGTTCQRLCNSDVDCTDAIFTRCAQIFTSGGSAVPGMGLCMRPCSLGSAFNDCGMGSNYACRFVPHHLNPATVEEVAGVCMQSGTKFVGQDCTGADYLSECGNQQLCVDGFCSYLCDDVAQCVAAGYGDTCRGLGAAAPDKRGYCEFKGASQDMLMFVDMSSTFVDMSF